MKWIRTIGALVLVGHFTLVCAYVMPVEFVQRSVRYISQIWVNPTFHQQWQLFAPDPPLCSCELQVRNGPSMQWVDISTMKDHYLWHRSIRGICRYAENDQALGSETLSPSLRSAIQRATEAAEVEAKEIRIVKHCIEDLAHPHNRVEVIMAPVQIKGYHRE